MNLYNCLKNDHKKIEVLMQALLSAENIDKRMNLFDKIREDILLHANTIQDANKEEEQCFEIENENEEFKKYLEKLFITKINE